MSRFQFQTVRDGKQEWRRGWDLNPRYPLRYVRFRGGSFQPLTHLSASDERKTLIARSFAKDAQDFGSGLTLRSRPLNASTFEADRFKHSRTSPHHSQCRVVSSAWRNMFSGKLAMATAGCQQLLFF